MKALYLDSSAILAWLFGEAPADEIRNATDAVDVVAVSALALVESERAIHRAVAQRLAKEAAAHKLRGLLAREQAQWVTMAVTASVLARARGAFPIEPVRTMDAIHLATALAFTEALPDLKMLALDRRIQKNATALGLALA